MITGAVLCRIHVGASGSFISANKTQTIRKHSGVFAGKYTQSGELGLGRRKTEGFHKLGFCLDIKQGLRWADAAGNRLAKHKNKLARPSSM